MARRPVPMSLLALSLLLPSPAEAIPGLPGLHFEE